MAVLLLAEHDNGSLAPATGKAVTAARAFGGDVDVLVVGDGCRAVAEQAAKLDGVRKVLIAEAPHLAQRLAEETAAVVKPLMQNYSVLLAPATTMGKNVLPRVAAMLDVAQISDIVEVKSPNIFVRPVYAGNALETVETSDKIVVGTVRTTAFASTGEGGSAPIEAVTPPPPVALSSYEGSDISVS
jgi:electron transfer flavoprotein alpha subunit